METAYFVVLVAALLAVGVAACWLLVKLVGSAQSR
jgi:hypothetical protein